VYPIRYLTLWPTLACNLDCIYCYRQVRGGDVMPEATALAALSWATASGAPFHVQLAGGEPTLVPDLVETIVRHVRLASGAATLALQTNGTRMDLRLARLCREHQVEVGVSLDGPPAIQEQLRGGASVTFRALEMLCAEDIPVRITAVLSAANAAFLERLGLLLASYPNVRGLALDPLVFLGGAEHRRDLLPTPEGIREGIQSLRQTFRYVESQRNTHLRWRELDLVRHALAGRMKSDYCHACRGESMAVAPDGSVYPCAQAIGDPSLFAGTVWEVDWTSLKRGFGNKPMNGPCDDCPLRGRCPGDCPSRLRRVPPNYQTAACVIYRTLAELEAR
jgi:uncharacterized protein